MAVAVLLLYPTIRMVTGGKCRGDDVIATQTQDKKNKGKQQPMRDEDRNLAVIPAVRVMLDAIEQHEPYGAVGGRS